MIPQELIRNKREGRELSTDELNFWVQQLTRGELSEGQIAAWAMAVFFRGMTAPECAALTRAMVHSGEVLRWEATNLGGPVVDKHSTGGVGDKVSLMLGPMIAACGGFVPMISGRGLGHTGGTLDKLDSIPGYRSTPDLATLRKVVREVGVAIIGQTPELAPADRRLYAIRDVTATIESIPLITASILSKKLAAGLDALVMDVKVGSGAFLPDLERARELAESIVRVAVEYGVPTTALLTDMNQVLGQHAGNALEVLEAVQYLRNEIVDARLDEVTLALGAELLVSSGLATSATEGRLKIQRVREDGSAAEIFARMVHALGGPSDLMDCASSYLPAAPICLPVPAPSSGVLYTMDVRQIGLAVVSLGGGRTRADQEIDHRVGFSGFVALGDEIQEGQPLAMVHTRSQNSAEQAILQLQQACQILPECPPSQSQKIVHHRIALDQKGEQD